MSSDVRNISTDELMQEFKELADQLQPLNARRKTLNNALSFEHKKIVSELEPINSGKKANANDLAIKIRKLADQLQPDSNFQKLERELIESEFRLLASKLQPINARRKIISQEISKRSDEKTISIRINQFFPTLDDKKKAIEILIKEVGAQ